MATLTLFSGNGPATATVDNEPYTLGVEFYVTQAATCTGVRVWVAGASSNLEQREMALYRVDSATAGTLVSTVVAVVPAAAGAWVTATFPTPVVLTANQRYRAVAYHWAGRYSGTANYWSSGAGASGITNGILVAPNSANATGQDQCSFFQGWLTTFPVNSFNATNYWIDPIIETASAPTVNAGADVASHLANTAFTRTATENDNGSTITARAWTIQSGPAGVGTTIGTAAALSWTPATAGTYVLRYSATNSAGTGTDDVQIIVTAPPAPVVNPISAQTVDPHVNGQVTVTATASGSPTSWSWTQLSGPTVTLTGTGASRTFTAPTVFGATSGTVVLGVTATNANGTSPQVQATVTVLPTLHATRVPGGDWVRATPTT